MAGWCSWLFVAALVAVCLEGSDAEKCTGQSAKLNGNDCAGWIDFFDAAGGSTWDECSTARTDPCSCNSMAYANISCGCTHRIFQPPCTPTIQAVTLSGVGLKGVITGAWGALSTLYGLRELDLSSNKLSGQLPNTPMLNTDMDYLDLSANMLTGMLPAKLGELTDITYLNVSRNRLSDGMQNIAKLTDVRRLDLSYNAFAGTVPKALQCGMTVLEFIDLSHNSFSGTVPVFICGIAKLMEVMHLEHNNFNGSIPQQFTEMTALTAIYAHDNQLSDVVPQSLAGLASLSALRLDDNAFSGALPSLPFANYIECALDNNRFACPLPKAASDCKEGPPTCK